MSIATPSSSDATTPPPKTAELDEQLYGGLSGLWRFSVADYQAMNRAEIIGPRTRVELLNGLVVRAMPQSPAHIHATRVLTRWFCRTLSDD